MNDINLPFAFQIGGEDLDPANIDDPQTAAIVHDIVESVTDRVGDLVCPEHNEPPRFLCTGEDLESLEMEVMGCCDRLVGMVKEKLAA